MGSTVRRRWSREVAVAVLVLEVIAGSASADKWPPPREWSATSSNGAFTFTATPAPEPLAEGSHSTGELRDRRGKSIWSRPLVNDMLPVSGLVADDGRHVVTFDNWSQKGHGPDVIAIYGSSGELICKLGLGEFLSRSEIIRAPASVSSIRWGGDHRIDKDQLVLGLRIMPWPVFESKDGKAYLEWKDSGADAERRIDLATGEILDPAQAHPVDQPPPHACADPLELRARDYWRDNDVLTACFRGEGSSGKREGPARLWKATSQGWMPSSNPVPEAAGEQ